MSLLYAIFQEIQEELGAAIVKFPQWPTDPLHAVAVVNEEAGELTQAVLQYTYEPDKSAISDIRTEAIQTAAMCVRFLASLDDYEMVLPISQHEQNL